MKRLAAALLAASLMILPAQAAAGPEPSASPAGAPAVDAASCVLMEKETGNIL